MPRGIDLDICTLALLQIGGEPMASHVTTRQGELCEWLYPNTEETLLASYPWTFATGETRLVPLAGSVTPAPPEAELWEHAYQLPPETIRLMGVRYEGSDSPQDYAFRDGVVWAAVAPIVALTIRHVPSREFPAYFVAALVARLAYQLCLPLTEHVQKAEMLYRIAGAEEQTARRIDAQSKPSSALKRFPLVDVR